MPACFSSRNHAGDNISRGRQIIFSSISLKLEIVRSAEIFPLLSLVICFHFLKICESYDISFPGQHWLKEYEKRIHRFFSQRFRYLVFVAQHSFKKGDRRLLVSHFFHYAYIEILFIGNCDHFFYTQHQFRVTKRRC